MSVTEPPHSRDAAMALMDASSLLYAFRMMVRKNVLIASGTERGYSLRDAAFALGLTEQELANLLYPADRVREVER